MLRRLEPASLSEAEIAILKTALFEPNLDKVHRLLDTYTEPVCNLFGLTVSGRTAAIAGIRRTGESSANLRHIAVDPQRQNQGLGRQLITSLIDAQGLMELNAETDLEAVEFYRRCGFRIASLGERYPGVERFLCTWPNTDFTPSGS